MNVLKAAVVRALGSTSAGTAIQVIMAIGQLAVALDAPKLVRAWAAKIADGRKLSE